MQTLPGDLPAIAADILERVRARAPRVHCITNTVAQAFTANILLSAGAVPSMTIAREEIGAFVRGASALLVNLGTFDPERREAVDIALDALDTADARAPWVLDPVFVDRSPDRAAYSRALLGRNPSVVRLNRAELRALAQETASDPVQFARRHRTCVAVSGATDIVTDGASSGSLSNGHPWMARVTAMGCAGSALVAACLAVEGDPLRAAAAGLIVLGVAGELAARDSRGPGSFAVAILDTLHALDRDAILRTAKVTS